MFIYKQVTISVYKFRYSQMYFIFLYLNLYVEQCSPIDLSERMERHCIGIVKGGSHLPCWKHRPRAPILPRGWKQDQCWAKPVKSRISQTLWGTLPPLFIPSVACKLQDSLRVSSYSCHLLRCLSSFFVSGHWPLRWLLPSCFLVRS